jgi:hypothetical protein
MPAYDFKARFAPLVRSGAKTNTIRSREAAVGGTAYLYTGQRTKVCECLGQGVIKSCLPVRLGWRNGCPIVTLRSKRLTAVLVQELAVSEGFADGREMVQWFQDTYNKGTKPEAAEEVEVYAGFLISWTPSKQGVAV